MPPRRSHKKSKAGCQRCKQRKIKCDEVKPLCGNCAKHGVSCDFEGGSSEGTTAIANPPPLVYHHSTTDSSGGVSSATSPQAASTPRQQSCQAPMDVIPRNPNPTNSRALELRLMHHFTAQTSLTFSDIDTATAAWQVDIPTIAYEAQYLMDAILAVAALHLRSYNPDDQTLIRASHGYMASSLAQYSSLLSSGLSELNAEALFSTAALIAFQASASRRFENLEDRYTVPLAWFHSFQGVKTVVLASWQWLRSSKRVFPIINSQPALSLSMDPQRKLFFAPLLGGLDEQLKSISPDLQAETKQAYEHAVAFLNWAYQSPLQNRVLGFAATVSRRFVDLVEAKDPRALVIVACFFALTKPFDNVWWLQGVARREVNGIFGLLPQVWWSKMQWPLKIANHDGPMDDATWGTPIYKLEEEKEGHLIFHNVFNHIELLAQIIESYAPPMPPD